jgi:hypothetical protein
MAVSMETGSNLIQNMLDETVVVGSITTNDNVMESYAYEERTGTPFTVPHVADMAALVWSRIGSDCMNHQIRYALAVSAQYTINGYGCDEEYGHGIVEIQEPPI